MPLFPSHAWMGAFCERLAVQSDVEQVASALDGTYRFVIEPAGPLSASETYDVRIAAGNDLEGPVIRVLESGVERPTLTLTASYERWRQVIEGELDVGMAVMLRRLRVSGDLSRLMRRLDSAQPLVQALREVDTQWLGEDKS